MRLMLLLGSLTFAISIGYSRVILGVHSWNQVLFGWSLGVWLAFTLHFCVKDAIVENAWNLLHGEEVRFGSMVKKCLALMFLAFAIQILDFYILDSIIVIEAHWKQNIAEKCGQDSLKFAF